VATLHGCARRLFATDAGGVGLNLQRAASACINIELPWNPAVLEQRIGRIYRLGQRRPIDVYNLMSEPGIESRIADLVGSKQALFTGLFDGTSDEVTFERAGSFLTRIERIVAPAISSALTRAQGCRRSRGRWRRARDRLGRGIGGRVV
jgi:superfamily II DNA/RNA helicase